MQTAANTEVPADKAGLAAALITASGPFGGSLGLAILSAIAAVAAAYVINHAESALASTGSQSLIENARVTGASGFGVSIGPGWIALGKGETGGSVLAEWIYPGKQKFATSSASGQPVSVIGWNSTGQQMTTTSVSYPARTWWHRTAPSGEPTPNPSGSCADAEFAVIAMGPGLASWPQPRSPRPATCSGRSAAGWCARWRCPCTAAAPR